MTGVARVDAIARHLFEAGRRREKFEWLDGPMQPRSLAEAYQAQSTLLGLREGAGMGRVAGWKIAVTSKAMQELCGIEQPCVGGLLDRNILTSPATVALKDYVRLGLEFELAAIVGADMGPGEAPYDAAAARARTRAVAPAFELIEDRGADYAGFDALSLVADNTWNGGVVLGPEIEGWRAVDWPAAPVTLEYNGAIERAVAGDAMGDPFAGLAAVANNLVERGLRLKAGDVVITGSTLKTRFAAAGDKATYRVDGLGSVEIAIVA